MTRRERLVLALAGLLVLPAVLFTAANLLKHGLGIAWLADALGTLAEPGDIMTTGHTALVLGGPILALILVLLRSSASGWGAPRSPSRLPSRFGSAGDNSRSREWRWRCSRSSSPT